MTKVARISMSLDEGLLDKFDGYVAQSGYPTRSEAIAGVMRSALSEQDWKKGTNVAGTISLVYDHHKRGVMDRLVDVQHDFGELIVCTQHVHLDHHLCMEVIVVRGRASDISAFLTEIKSVKGLKHSSLMIATSAS